MVLIPLAVIMPGAVFLISNYKADDDRSLLAWTPDLVDAAVSLPNSRLRLRLYDSDPAAGRVIDEADDGSDAPFAGLGGDNKASMVRVSLDMSGILPDAWATAQEPRAGIRTPRSWVHRGRSRVSSCPTLTVQRR